MGRLKLEKRMDFSRCLWHMQESEMSMTLAIMLKKFTNVVSHSPQRGWRYNTTKRTNVMFIFV